MYTRVQARAGDISIEKIQSASAASSLKNSNPFSDNMSLNKPWKAHRKTNTPYWISEAFFLVCKCRSQGNIPSVYN